MYAHHATCLTVLVANEVRFTVETGSWFSKKTKWIALHADKMQVLTSEK